MRILQACPYSWDSPGGVQVHVQRLAHELTRRGHEVRIIAPGLRDHAADAMRAVGRPFRVPFNGSVVPLCCSRAAVSRVREALADFEPDLVHAHEPFAPSISMMATWLARVPVVGTFHAYAEHSRLLALASPALRLVSKRIDVRIAVSDAAAAYASHGPAAEFERVPNGTDVGLFERAEPATGLPPGRRLLFVNRLDPRKGFRVMIRAFAGVAERHPDVSLVVVGDGQEASEWHTLPLATRQRVVMLGAVPHERVAPYFAAADVFVAPATGGESFGIVLLEAMAAGAPIVASNIAGYREVVRDEAEALLVPPGDADALGRALSRLLDTPSLAAALAARGRVRVQDFSWARLGARVEAMYEAAIARRDELALASLGRADLRPAPLSSFPTTAAPPK